MPATLERFATGSTCSAGLLRLFGILLLIGAVATGCTSQEGKTNGPSHPTGQTGAPDGGVVIFLSAQSSPGNNQAGANQFLIIVLVQTPGGRPLHGTVRWCREGLAGIAFNEVVPFPELMAWLRPDAERRAG